MKRNLINLAVVFGTLLVFGILKVPFEIKMEEEMREKDLLPPKIELTDRNSVGQAGYAAALGGFRDVLASYNYLKAYNLHAERDWFEMERTLNTVVTLQPRSPFYWEMAGWQLAFNTSSWTKDNQKLSPTERYIQSRYYVEKGDEFLKRGLVVLPGDYDISRERVRLFTDTHRFPDYRKAIHTSAQMLKHGELDFNKMLFAWGDYIYALGAEDGNDYNAYVELKKLYSQLSVIQRVPTQRLMLYTLQNRLMIPLEDRIPDEELLFNSEKLLALNEIYNYEGKVNNTNEKTLKRMLSSLKNSWKQYTEFKRTDLMRMKIYVLQQYLQSEGDDVISDDVLFFSDEHKELVLNKLEYRRLVDGAGSKAKDIHNRLANIHLSGKASQNEKELLALIQLKYGKEIGEENFVSWGELLLTKKDIYNELFNFWSARNALNEKRAIGSTMGLKSLPVGELLEQIRQLEEELNIDEADRIKNTDDFTSRRYPTRGLEN